MSRRKLLTIIGVVAIVFIGGLTAILVNNSLRAFSPVASVPENTMSVSGQGGNAVAVGEYLYFIGNFVPTASIEYKQNEHNRVTYGAIYRVRLGEDGLPSYDNTWLENWSYNYEHRESFLEEIYGDQLNSQVKGKELIVPKIAGFESSALWVFGNYLVYTSPNNQMNRFGELQSARIDFFRVDLDGRNHRRIYTSDSSTLTRNDFTVAWVPTSGNSPEGRASGRSYLLINDDGELRRVSISHNLGRVTTISEAATSFAFPIVTDFEVSPTAQAHTQQKGFGGVMNFVYFTENREETDSARGNLMKRFSISSGNIVTIGRAGSFRYTAHSLSGGAFAFERACVDNVNPTILFIASGSGATDFHGETWNYYPRFRATDLLQPGYRVILPTWAPAEDTPIVQRFFMLVEGQLFTMQRKAAADVWGNVFSRPDFARTAIALDVAEVIHVSHNSIYYVNSSGFVVVIDAQGRTNAQRVLENPSLDTLHSGSLGMPPQSRVNEVNITVFQPRLANGARNGQNEFFFYMRTIGTVNLPETDPDDPDAEIVHETMTIPVIVDRNGRSWILAVLDERFVAAPENEILGD